MENLEKSELVIAKILGVLMEQGLQRKDLEFSSLGLEREFLLFFVTCVEWLEAEGITRSLKIVKSSNGDAVVLGPTITARGLTLMGRTIRAGTSETTVGDAVMRTAKDTKFYTGLADLTGGFVGGLMKSLGS